MIRKGKYSDLKQIDDLAVQTINYMINSGLNQWTLSYPRKEHFKNDIDHDYLYVYEENNEILGALALIPGPDKNYMTIDTWKKQHSIVLHRVLTKPSLQRKGVATKLFQFVFEYALENGYESIKIDTHKDNIKMLNLLENKFMFTPVGYIEVMDRFGYEKVIGECNE